MRVALALLLAVPAFAQDVTLRLVGEVQFEVSSAGLGGTDVWGYTAPDGAEYALMGVMEGTAVVAVPSLEVVAVVPGPRNHPSYFHRDIKTLGPYAYVVSEATGQYDGLQIIDLSGLPDTATPVGSFRGMAITSHNFSIDTATGYAYLVGDTRGSVRIVDLADPEAPVEVGAIPTPDLHDVYARNDTVWVAEGLNHSFAIWDVRDKSAPVLLTRFTTPSGGYAHNIWPDETGTLAVTTEETVGETVKVWDTSDLGNVELVGEYLGANGLAHNAHVRGGYVWLSHYGAGLTVVDLAQPSAPREVARYDTYLPGDPASFAGNWGAYPFADGYLYGSDIEGKLTVLAVEAAGVAAGAAPAPRTSRLVPYPNPTRDGARLRLEPAPSARLAAYDVLGREVAVLHEGAVPAAGTEVAVATAGWPVGVYVLRLTTASGVRTARLTVAR